MRINKAHASWLRPRDDVTPSNNSRISLLRAAVGIAISEDSKQVRQ